MLHVERPEGIVEILRGREDAVVADLQAGVAALFRAAIPDGDIGDVVHAGDDEMAVGQADTIFARHDPKVAAVGANDMLRLRIRRACLQDVAIRPFEVLRKLRFYEIRGGTSEHGVRREIVEALKALFTAM